MTPFENVRPQQLLIPRRARLTPILSTMAGSAMTALPIVATAPVMPPLGLLMLLAWRLLRPELWRAWIALPLGLFDDLMSGQPLGSAVTLWTIVFLTLDSMDARIIWRDYWMEWLIASIALAVCLIGGALAARFALDLTAAHLLLPQLLVAIGCFPAAVRLCAILDRWRLRR